MAYILDRMKPLLKYIEVKAAEKKDSEIEEKKKSSNIWPRLLLFNPSSNCDEEEENESDEKKNNEECNDSQPQAIKYKVEIKEECEDETPDEIEECDSDEDDNSYFKGIPACMYNGAKYGLKDGALTGIFLGGCLGMGKYFSSEKNDDSSDEESTLNNNIIFVTAANCAIAVAVLATVFCSTKAAIFCN